MTFRERHEHFMEIALKEARTALNQGEFPVGCIIVYNDRVIARGRRVNSRFQTRNELDHAEINGLRQLDALHHEIDLSKITFYSTLEPCLMCFGALLINQVGTVVYSYEDAMGGGSNLDRARLAPLYRNLDIEIIPFVLREKSLALFKKFFNLPDCSYLNDTYLAQYTREQK